MGEETAISWCDHTFNPWIGCTKVSPACDGCYAEALMDKRYGRVQWGPHGERVRTGAANWQQPLRWNRAAACAGRRAFVFCASLADVFDNQVQPEWRADLFELIRATPSLVWLLLTKRPQNIVKMVKALGFMPPNIAFGTSVEDRQRVETNLRHLIVAAGLRPLFLFASCEPLLGDLGDLSPWMKGDPWTQHHADGEKWERGIKIGVDGWPRLPAIAWWIAGGETDQGGHRARPMHPAWVRSIRDQCAAHGLAFHFKQWGEYGPCELHPPGAAACSVVTTSGQHLVGAEAVTGAPEDERPEIIARFGKARAGRFLDGREHKAMPEARVAVYGFRPVLANIDAMEG